MAAAVKSPIQEFLAKLKKTDEKSANLATTSFAKGDFVEFSKAISGNEALIPEGFNTNSFLDAARREWDEANPLSDQPNQASSPVKGATLADFFGEKKTHGGGGGPLPQEKNPLLSLQEEQLLKEDDGKLLLDVIARIQKNPENISDDDLKIMKDKLSAPALFRDQHTRLLTLFEKYINGSKTLADEKKVEVINTVRAEFENNPKGSHNIDKKIEEFDHSDSFKDAKATSEFIDNKDALAAMVKAHAKESPEELLRGLMRRQQATIAQLSPSPRVMKRILPKVPDRDTRRFFDEFENFFYNELQNLYKNIPQQLEPLNIPEGELPEISTPQEAPGRNGAPTPAQRGGQMPSLFPNKGNRGGRGRSLLGRGASKLKNELFKKARDAAVKFALSNPEVSVPVGIAILIVVIAIILIVTIVVILVAVVNGGGNDTKSGGDIPGLDVHLSAPQNVANGQDITYFIRVTYSGNGPITIKDTLPTDTQRPTNISGKYILSNNTITWFLSQNQPSPTPTPNIPTPSGTDITPTITQLPSSSPSVYFFSFTVHPAFNDVDVYDSLSVTDGKIQTGRSSITVVGNPPPEDTRVIQLVKDIRAACPGGLVSPSTYWCIDRVPNLTQKVRDQLKYDGQAGAFLQCGIFAEAVLMYKDWPILWANAPSAISWWYYYIRYIFDPSWQAIPNSPQNHMRVGDVPIWRSDTFGHVAYVTQVVSDDTFQVAEANYVSGVVDLRYYIRYNKNIPTYEDTSYLPLEGWLRRR